MKQILNRILPWYGKYRKVAYSLPIVLGLLFISITAYTRPKITDTQEKHPDHITTTISIADATVENVEERAVEKQNLEEIPETRIQKTAQPIQRSNENMSQESQEKNTGESSIVNVNEGDEIKETMEVYTATPVVKNSNTIHRKNVKSVRARVMGKQLITSKNPMIALTLLEEVVIDGILIPEGSIVSAVTHFEGEHIRFNIPTVTVKNERYHVDLKVVHANGRIGSTTKRKAKLKLNNDMMIIEVK